VNTAAMRTPTVLVVDDTPANIGLLVEALQSDYEVLVASDGPTALAIARGVSLPDLILLDIMMPDMDGYEVCRQLKADVRTQDIPIMFVTADASEHAEERGFSLGAVDYITKPFSLPVVRARVRTQVQLRRRTAMLEHLALIDGLTGLANRHRFDEVLEQEWRRAKRSRSPIALLFIDVDRFKAINDQLGHGMGDELLRRIARAVLAVAHRPADLAARYGGDEFVVLLPGTDTAGAERLAAALCAEVSAPAFGADLALPGGISVSVGCAQLVPDDEDGPEQLVQLADAAMFKAKRAARRRAPEPAGVLRP
jgi:diguanylate cyclase (GGDEF)-like protein